MRIAISLITFMLISALGFYFIKHNHTPIAELLILPLFLSATWWAYEIRKLKARHGK